MQNAKDSFYMALRTRLAAINPERTILLRGAVRPGILVEEAEAPFSQLPSDVFVLRWLGLGVGYGSCLHDGGRGVRDPLSDLRTQSFGGLDRGRSLSEMDEELVAMLQPFYTPKLNYTATPPAAMLTQVFWDEPALDAGRDAAGPVEPFRKSYGLQLPGAGGVNGGNMVFGSRAGDPAGARVFCACQSDGADAGTLRSGGAGRVQPGRSARSVDQPGLDSGVFAQTGKQDVAGFDRHSGRNTGAGARDACRRR